jgi:hypothetical protein
MPASHLGHRTPLAMSIGLPINITPASKRLKRRATSRCRALFLCLALLIPPLLITTRCGAEPVSNAYKLDARAADERCTALTCQFAADLRAGRIDGELYALLMACRTEAAREVTVWVNTGRREWEARACMAALELAVESLRFAGEVRE